MYHFDMLVTKKVEIRSGEFYNQNPLKKSDKGARIKNNLPTEKYGSYSGINYAYVTIVKVNKKGKNRQKMIGIPIYIDKQAKTNLKIKEEYISNIFGLCDNDTLEIVKDKIPFNSILDIGGKICSLIGASQGVEICNAKEIKIDANNLEKWKYTLNKLLNNHNYKVDDNKYNEELSGILIYIMEKLKKEYKLYEDIVPEIENYFKFHKVNELSIDVKENIIREFLKLLGFNNGVADFKKYGDNYPKSIGRKTKLSINHAKIINYSITGIWEQTYEF